MVIAVALGSFGTRVYNDAKRMRRNIFVCFVENELQMPVSLVKFFMRDERDEKALVGAVGGVPSSCRSCRLCCCCC